MKRFSVFGVFTLEVFTEKCPRADDYSPQKDEQKAQLALRNAVE